MNNLSKFIDIKSQDVYWTEQFKKLPKDIQKYIRSLGNNQKDEMISIVKKLYELMEKDIIYADESKPYVAFATVAKQYINKKEK